MYEHSVFEESCPHKDLSSHSVSYPVGMGGLQNKPVVNELVHILIIGLESTGISAAQQDTKVGCLGVYPK